MLSCFMYVTKLLLNSGAFLTIRHIGHPFAELVLSIPQMFAMLSTPIIGRRLTIAGCWRRLANRDLTKPGHSDLSLSICQVRERSSEQDRKERSNQNLH
jgi:hypothetical protein